MRTVADLKARVCAEIDRRKGEIVAISEHIMKHPESGYREVRTAEFVAGWFRRMGLECQEGLALTGVKTRLRCRSSGPTVAVLGELDSLIVGEHPLADPKTHAAHACGHNAQVASMIGAGMGCRRSWTSSMATSCSSPCRPRSTSRWSGASASGSRGRSSSWWARRS